MPSPSRKPHAVVVDWGTTNFRATLLDSTGVVLDEIETGRGIQFVTDGAFEAELTSALTPWLAVHGALPVIALGMINSRNGWVEVPYVSCPATIEALAAGALMRELPNGSDLVLLPGITDLTRAPFPDVMRGEETQVVGSGLQDLGIVILPGTHCKWVRVGGGRIEGFQTFVTGEIFALLSQHSFIAKTATGHSADFNRAAFDQGVHMAEVSDGADAAPLTLLFSVRTGTLADQLQPADMRDYVSGLLIGMEFRQARDAGWFNAGDTVRIVGNDGLNARYQRAAALFGLAAADGNSQAANVGALMVFEAAQRYIREPA